MRLEGDRPWLNPNATLHVGLALHELIANSVSYGAMSRPDGYATFRAAVQRTPQDGATLLLVWREVIGSQGDTAPAPTPQEKRFGSVALERLVPASLNGSAQLKIDRDLLEYRLTVPPGNFEA